MVEDEWLDSYTCPTNNIVIKGQLGSGIWVDTMQTYINMVISNIIMYVFFHYWSLLFLFFLFCFIFFVIFVLFLFWGLQQMKTFLIFAFLCEIICNVLYIRTLLWLLCNKTQYNPYFQFRFKIICVSGFNWQDIS